MVKGQNTLPTASPPSRTSFRHRGENQRHSYAVSRFGGAHREAAYIAALKKENLYYNNFVIPAGHMVPLFAETGGRFDATFSR